MLHRFRIALIVLSTLALAACGNGIVKRVSEPAASLQQLTVRADGNWTVALRLQNYSSMPMTFDDVALALTVGDSDGQHRMVTKGLSESDAVVPGGDGQNEGLVLWVNLSWVVNG